MSKRLEQIKQAAESKANELSSPYQAFVLGAHWADMNPMATLDEEYAWKVYNFINEWKEGKYGEIPLQKALYEHRV